MAVKFDHECVYMWRCDLIISAVAAALTFQDNKVRQNVLCSIINCGVGDERWREEELFFQMTGHFKHQRFDLCVCVCVCVCVYVCVCVVDFDASWCVFAPWITETLNIMLFKSIKSDFVHFRALTLLTESRSWKHSWKFSAWSLFLSLLLLSNMF